MEAFLTNKKLDCAGVGVNKAKDATMSGNNATISAKDATITVEQNAMTM